ncbi:hypothetical protein WH52_03060 [Tenacibaculum holothuriorum]|uniref:Uncharacterized protein n=1 Tax=Tenacibaculum holothuriorum TaxID=1635173 RepID=A0A1Y2PDY1_9FLAO|nr:hypothetical protein [Tenacibaculum holothuriorum]OSY88672.1 hypothetical protein WH52_03060 [Tenacibaculum holothuriorum]
MNFDKEYNRSTLDINSEKKHKIDLGIGIPEGYFSKSSEAILKQTVGKKKTKVISLQKKYVWSAAAAIALLFTLAVVNQFESSQAITVDNDVLIASLLTEDAEVDTFIEDFVDDSLLTEDVFSE